MKEFYYLNSRNEKLDFMEFPYLARDVSELKNYGHSYKYERDKISEFYDGVSEIPFSVNIYGDTVEEYKYAANRFFEVTEYDIISGKNGKLYCDDQYVLCNLISSKKIDKNEEIGFHIAYVNMVTDFPYWIRQLKRQFLAKKASEEKEGLDFPTDFAFDFAKEELGNETWNIDHYTSSHFQMRIYGPCMNPTIYINDYPYQIKATLQDNEYLVIDSRDHTVTKYLANGETENLYNSREFKYSVFEKIPGGFLRINWSGIFGFDIILFLERSEPRW